jgi:hypothetical protein
MRFVVRNRTLTPADGGPDVRDSYFENCIFQGDFSGFDFRNVSLNNCTLTGNFSAIQHRYLTSFRCNWRQAQLPPDVSSYKHDMVIAVLAQALSRLSPQRRAAVQDVIDNVGLDYYRSWPDSLRRLVVELGLTRAQMKNFLLDAFSGYPLLLARLRAAADIDWSSYIVPTAPPEPTLMETGAGVVDLLTDPRVVGEDRWAIERTLETPGVRIHLWTMHPYPTGISKVEDTMWPEQRASWDWWAKYRGWED